MAKSKKNQALNALANAIDNYEQKLEPKFITEYSDGKHRYRENVLGVFEKLMPDSAKEKWFAIYEAKKDFPIKLSTIFDEDPVVKTGERYGVQIELPHQARLVGGICLVMGAEGDYLKEAIAKGYLEFIGVEKESEHANNKEDEDIVGFDYGE